MNTDRVDVETLPEIKISSDTFEMLPVFNHENPSDARVGLTWKREVNSNTENPVTVLCRWKSAGFKQGVTVEMMRPVVTGSIQVPDEGGYRRKKR